MRFTVFDYVFPSVIVPFFVLICGFALAVIISIKLKKKPGMVLILFIVWVYIFCLCIYIYADAVKYPLALLLGFDTPDQVVVGQVTKIEQAPSPPFYYCANTHSFQSAKLITLNEGQYYVIQIDIESGDWVKLVSATTENVVLSWEKLSQQEALNSLLHPAPSDENKSNLPYNLTAKIGRYIRDVSVVIFIIAVFLQYPLGKYISPIIQRKDVRCSARVIPNRLGLIHFLVMFVPILCILIGAGMAGFEGAFLIATLGGIMLLYVMLKKQTTYVRFANCTLVVKELQKEFAISINDISTISWGKSQIPYCRSLVISLRTGQSYVFEQEYFWGLSNMYKLITKAIGNRDSLC